MATNNNAAAPVVVLIGLLIGLLVVIGGFLLLRGDAPDELAIGDRADEVAEDDDATAVDDPADAEAAVDEAVSGEIDIVGAWTLTADSVAGYRVVEDFIGGVADFEAVGRTSTIEGELTIEDTSVTEASFSVDVASITSDDPRRDGQFTGPILMADEFPTADFVLVSPIDLGEVPDDGEVVNVDATGELTLRDFTVEVTFPLMATLEGAEVQVAGAVPVVFADFGIDNPSNAFVSVRDEGVVEFSLFFEMAG